MLALYSVWYHILYSGYIGVADFSYVISDGQLSSNSAKVTINVLQNENTNQPPTLTKFDSCVVKANEHTATTITFEHLLSHSDASDIDGNVVAFDIKSVDSGTLLIGTDSNTAIAWDALNNFVIDATHIGFWTSETKANGKLNAFTAVAKDNGGLESSPSVQAKVHVQHKVEDHLGSEKQKGGNDDDRFDVSSGQDTITGGLGSDDFNIRSTSVVIKDLGLGGDALRVSNVASVNAILAGPFIADTYSNNDGLVIITDTASFNVDLHLATGSSGFTVNASRSTNSVSLIGTLNIDTLTGGKGNDTIDGGADNDVIVADDGNDSIIGGLGNDNLNAGKGDDTLNGGAGKNTLIGGLGNDTFIIDVNATDNIIDLSLGDLLTIRSNANVSATALKGWVANSGTVNDGSLVINTSGSVNVSNMTGAGSITVNTVGTKNVSLTGGSQTAQLVGGVGKDILMSGSGLTTLMGGLGDDTYIIDSTSVTVIEGTDAPTKGDLIKSSINYTLDANVENLTLTGSVANVATGNALNNVITANNVGVTLDGGLGDDKLIGGTGDDTFIVDSLLDVVVDKLGGTDTVVSSVNYVLGPTVENLTLTGSAAINGTVNKLANIIIGNAGNNILTAGLGNATIEGGLGNDTLLGGKGINVLNGGAGDDIINANIRGQGTNTIDGGTGNDSITGGAGVNILSGGEGADTFVFVKGNGLTTITDFVSGTDHIQINSLAFKGLTVGSVFDDAFVANATGVATNTSQHFIYNTDNGSLYFDADGSAGKFSSVSIEVLGTSIHPILVASDIVLV